MSNRRYTVWSDAFWNALGHGMSEAEAERHAAAKVAAFDLQQRRDRSRKASPEGAPLVHADYL